MLAIKVLIGHERLDVRYVKKVLIGQGRFEACEGSPDKSKRTRYYTHKECLDRLKKTTY